MLQLVKENIPNTGSVELRASRDEKVLLVVDNLNIQEELASLLRLDGYEVLACGQLESATRHLKTTSSFDLLLCELSMEKEDSLEFYAELRTNDNFVSLPFIFFSSSENKPRLVKARELGCDAFVNSNFGLSEIIATVRGKLSSNRKRAGELNRQVEQYKKRIVNTLSHEFRTPLVAINTGAELLANRFQELDAEDVGRLIKSIQRGGQRLQHLVEDFMTLQQMEAGLAFSVYERLKRPVSISDLVETAVMTYSESGTRSQADCTMVLHVENSAEDWEVDGCEPQLVDLLQRLLDNAHKFSHSGAAINVKVSCDESEVSILIRDYGEGIESNDLIVAKNLFSQVDRESNEQQGAGIGLSIATYYAQIHGGSLCFKKPNDGLGLEVELKLPGLS